MPVQFRELVARTPLIATVRVEAVVPVGGGRFATATVLQVLKGPPLRRIWILADPHFLCDTSTLVAGEAALMFLDAHGAPIPGEVDASIPKGGIALAIAHFGRGRMPIRDEAGKHYVDLWAADVLLPADIPSIPTPVTRELEQVAVLNGWKVPNVVTKRLFKSVELKVMEQAIRRLSRPSVAKGRALKE